MTDVVASEEEPVVEPEPVGIERVACKAHSAFESTCDDCKKASDMLRGPRESKRALSTAERLEDDILAIGTAGSNISQRYAQMIDFAYERATTGGSGRGQSDGSSRDVAATLAATAAIRRYLGDVCTAVTNAHQSMNRAAYALDECEDAVDLSHPDELEPSERQERLREKPATRTQLAESIRARARSLRREAEETVTKADKMDRDAAALERQVRRDAQRMLEVQARQAGAPSMSKSQRRRAKRSGNGYVSAVVPAGSSMPDAAEQIDALRTGGNLPRQDQADHFEREDT
jgi:superfamily II DNA helicase RecQ